MPTKLPTSAASATDIATVLVDLPVASVRTDGGTQARAGINQQTVEDYTQAMVAGAVFPPVVVFQDTEHYWLADGFHRMAATVARKEPIIAAEVRIGTREDAILFAAGANKAHGLPRSNEDKRKAVTLLLGCKRWSARSDAWIAKKAGVSDKTVAAARRNLGVSEVELRQGKDGKTRKLPARRQRHGGDESLFDMPAVERYAVNRMFDAVNAGKVDHGFAGQYLNAMRALGMFMQLSPDEQAAFNARLAKAQQ